MAWTDALLRVQEIDLDLDRRKARLTEVEVALQNDAALQEARRHAESRAATVERVRKKQKDLEFELGRVETERKQTETRLYGGVIRNPRELSDMQAKAQSLKRRQSQLEEAVLETMIALEEAQAVAEKAHRQVEAEQATWDGAQSTLLEEQALLEAAIATLEAERRGIQESIPKRTLESYRYLRRKMGGVAVARLQMNTCTVCGVRVTSGRKQAVRSGKETFCDSCGRLLVA
ncbi:MAG: zinc ribbon domain-containing protein [Anaerolineales bacterium]